MQKLEGLVQKSLDEEVKSSDENAHVDNKLQRAKALSVDETMQTKNQVQTLTDLASSKTSQPESKEVAKEPSPVAVAENSTVAVPETDTVDSSKPPADVPQESICDKCAEAKAEENGAYLPTRLIILN